MAALTHVSPMVLRLPLRGSAVSGVMHAEASELLRNHFAARLSVFLFPGFGKHGASISRRGRSKSYFLAFRSRFVLLGAM